METRASLRAFRAALFSALGLPSFVACGGATAGPEEKTRPGPFLECPPGSGDLTGHPGYASCGSALHRPAKVTCPGPSREPGYVCQVPHGGAAYSSCTVDDDCHERPYGSCEFMTTDQSGCSCTYGCSTDADCGSGMICLCGERHGYCTRATCTVDADCKDGALCLTHDDLPGCNGRAFACQSEGDACIDDGDCSAGMFCSQVEGVRRCVGRSCVPGRPFLVAGAARVAPLVRRSDWCSALAPDTAGLAAVSRAVLAAHWTEIALMEHASIAAFARFALELLSLGAPASLVAETHAAIADETAHARDAFALASAYGGAKVGPGDFGAAAEALASRSPEDVVLTAIAEGCVGETVAAMEAEEALARATDGVVRTALTKVAADEARHAALAWRFIAWVIAEDPAGLRAAALAGLETMVRATGEPQRALQGTEAVPPLADHGYVGGALREEVRRRVLADVVVPCARALLGSAARAGVPFRRSELHA